MMEKMKMTRDDWSPWIELVRRGSIQWALDVVPDRWKRLVTLALTAAKWDDRSRLSDGELERADALCLAYYQGFVFNFNGPLDCLECPLFNTSSSCWEQQSLFQRWKRARTSSCRKKLARELHGYFLNLYEREYNSTLEFRTHK